jgi:DNA-binding response OmpR family regulator
MTNILCIDDDRGLADLLRQGLSQEGIDITTASSGSEAVRLARGQHVDLVVLDANGPDLHGSKVLAALHAFSTAPIALLDTRLYEGAGLERPVNVAALATRVKTVLDRATTTREGDLSGVDGDANVYHVAGARFDPAANELIGRDGARVRLTRTESQILALLLAHEGLAVSTDRMWRHIGGADSGSDVNVVKTHLRHLREKIAQLPGAPAPIRTLPGYGYLAPAA